MVMQHLTDTIIYDIHSYGQLLKEQHIPVENLIVFGSYARGTNRSDSDIDLCVVSPSFGHDSFEEGVMLSILAKQINILLEPHPYHPDDLSNRYDRLAREILQYGIQIPSS